MVKFCCCVTRDGVAHIGIRDGDYWTIMQKWIMDLQCKLFERQTSATYLQDCLKRLHIGPELMIFTNQYAQDAFYKALTDEANMNKA